MTSYKIDDIARDVRVVLDNNMNSDPLTEIGDVDTLAIDEIIQSKICEAVKRIHTIAPVHLLDADEKVEFGNVVWTGKDCGYVKLPKDFFRLVVFQMSDWERPVFHPISVEDPTYALQSSRFKGLRGNPQKPVCAISIIPEVGPAMEFYSCKDNKATIRRSAFLPLPEISKEKEVRISPKCYDAVIYTIGALVLASFGDKDQSAVFSELAKAALI